MNDTPLRFVAGDHGIATLTLDDDARLNAMSPALLRGLLAALARVHDGRSIRLLVLRGQGRAFCAGADLAAIGDDVRGVGATIQDDGNRVIAALRALPVPTLAAVNGAAAGGGVGLALACDVVLAARSAYFYMPFVPALGLVPDLGSAWFMQSMVGRARSLGSSLLGNRISAEQAMQWGLIWACVDDAALDDEVARIAARLAALPPQAAVEARALHDAARTSTLAEQLSDERERQRTLVEGGAFAEGVRAFLAKRRPVFPGR